MTSCAHRSSGLSPSARHRRPPTRGFTLIEAMVVVALLGIVAAIAAPSFRSFIGTMNTKAVAFDLISDLTSARSEAIKRNAVVDMVPIGGDWSKGWQVLAGTEVLRERAELASAISVGGAPAAGVSFLSNGRIGADTASANRKWSVTSTISGVTKRCVVITLTGSARSATGDC